MLRLSVRTAASRSSCGIGRFSARRGSAPAVPSRFLLVEQVAEEEVVSLQLAEEEPLVGTSPQWVPDAPPAAPPAPGPVYVQVQTPQGIVLAPVISGPLPTYPAAPPAPVVDVPPPAPAFPSSTSTSIPRVPRVRPGRAQLADQPDAPGTPVVGRSSCGNAGDWRRRLLDVAAESPCRPDSRSDSGSGGRGCWTGRSDITAGAYSRETLTADPRVVPSSSQRKANRSHSTCCRGRTTS